MFVRPLRSEADDNIGAGGGDSTSLCDQAARERRMKNEEGKALRRQSVQFFILHSSFSPKAGQSIEFLFRSGGCRGSLPHARSFLEFSPHARQYTQPHRT